MLLVRLWYNNNNNTPLEAILLFYVFCSKHDAKIPQIRREGAQAAGDGQGTTFTAARGDWMANEDARPKCNLTRYLIISGRSSLIRWLGTIPPRLDAVSIGVIIERGVNSGRLGPYRLLPRL